MKFRTAIFSMVFALTLAMTSVDSEAKRLGGGQSVGRQSPNVTHREAAPGGANSVSNSAAKPSTPAAAAAPQAPKRPWGAMLGGLAAGLGLAWLASSLGLGGAFGQIIMFALLAMVIMVVVGFVIRKFKNGSANAPGAGRSQTPFAFQGAGNAADATAPRGYSPENVGNDSSARPWERNSMGFEAKKPELGTASAAGGSMIGSGLQGSQSWGVPDGFDADGFLKACKVNFVTLQNAWDHSDIQSLRAMMTDDMLDQIKAQLADRESHTGGGNNKTDVVMLDAKLLGIEELTDVYMASVEFSGMIREDASAGASPFREVWNMTKPRVGSGGWLVAGVQALQ